MKYSWKAFEDLVVSKFISDIGSKMEPVKVYGVPRGGWFVAMVLQKNGLAKLVDHEQEAEMVVDDLIDSGRTKLRYTTGEVMFWSPIVKNEKDWVSFPWESKKKIDHEDIIVRYLEAIGEDPCREGLLETPKRVVKSWKELYSGYDDHAENHLSKCFESSSKEMVICKDIEFYSMCEHHMIPFVGMAHIGYIPNGRVVGLSKLARTVEVFSRRLQIQEQLCEQIADALMKHVPQIDGCAVVVQSKHFCMCSRGVSKQNSQMITSSLRGKFNESDVRKEFLSLIK